MYSWPSRCQYHISFRLYDEIPSSFFTEFDVRSEMVSFLLDIGAVRTLEAELEELATMYPKEPKTYEYMAKYLLSPLFFTQLRKESDTTTINQLTQKNFNKYLVPLPPLAEQHRIVAKIEELFAGIEQLKK